VNETRTSTRLIVRAFRLVTNVRAEEIPLALALAVNVCLLLTAYYVIKPVREALILSLDAGAEYKSYMSAAIALALLFAVPAYAKLVDRVPRLKLVVGVTLFFASHLIAFYALSLIPTLRARLGLAFYVWIGVFNTMVVAQLWSFATDLYDPERGKRLFPLVALGASLGAAFGSKIASLIVVPLGVYAMLLVSAGMLACCAALFVVAERLAQRANRIVTATNGAVTAPNGASAARASAHAGAFELVVRNRYVLFIALFTLVFNFANSNGEYMLGKLVKAAALAAVADGKIAAPDVGAFIGKTYADFFFAVNILGVLLQALLVSRVVRYGGLGIALLVLPVIAFGNGIAVLAFPLLAVLRLGKTLENATDYSLNNTVRQMLWLPTSAELKYKAKQAVDTFFVRLGDVSSALLVAIGAGACGWSVRAFALTNALLAALWVALGALILIERRRLGTQRAESAPPIATLTA
jgi:AAA family ATP:ADP antiporter